MTTIAYRDGVIAGDSQISSGSVFDCTAVKVARNHFGDLAGAAGTGVFIDAFLAWFAGGEKGDIPERPEGNEAIIIRASNQGQVECWEESGRCTISAPYYAAGSGKHLALGAMAFGATSAQAVVCAAKHCVYTGGDIIAISHEDEQTQRKRGKA